MRTLVTNLLAGLLLIGSLIVFPHQVTAGSDYTILKESFEGAWPGPWAVGDDNTDAGLDYWGVTGERKSDGIFSAWVAQAGTNSENGQPNWVNQYQDDSMDAFLRIQLDDLSGYAEVTLRFDTWLELGNGDSLSVRVQSGGGWFDLWSVHGPYSQDWINIVISVPLSSQALEFRYVSADTHTVDLEGAYVDDIELIGVDDTPPVLNINEPESGEWFPSRTVTVSWTASDMASGLLYVEVRRDLGPWINVGLESSATFTGLAEGVHSVTIRAVDKVGNTITKSVAFGVDVTPPTIALTIPADEGIYNSSVLTAQWQIEDRLSGVFSLDVSIDGGVWFSLSTSLTTYQLSGLLDGVHTFALGATDEVGNAAVRQVTFTIDTTPPSVSILEPAAGMISTSSDVTLRWEIVDATSGVAGLEVMLDSGDWVAVDPSTAEYRLRGLADGTHKVTVRVVDAAGNVAEEELAFKVDTNPFSPYGPFYGVPLYALIAAGVALLLFFATRRGWLPALGRWMPWVKKRPPAKPREHSESRGNPGAVKEEAEKK